MQFILASGNAHKAVEFSELLVDSNLSVLAAPRTILVDENGSSFQENAYKKAWAYFQEFKTPVLADDSGLVVESLPDELGVQSARFGGAGLTDLERCLLLLKKLEGVENRAAYFVCVLCFIQSPQEIYFFEGRLRGKIALEMKGDHGFGYDPLFLPEKLKNQTYAEDFKWKMTNGHRAQAVYHAKNFFEANITLPSN
jgi:XTP/dITP diphosphohydrolase